ncbi:hypothetical protein D5086_029417 [Populus alba]|uniref:Uncharacterized protein n=3 Tax=Populus TaxID=3689 RepID=A0A4U5P4R0_POPAL|nr:hypothetical protein NC653_036568 [Populus alba x Populus x berolinensis]TKR91208.1 hypothetical protein D5086_0000225640 [Populus alba]
MHIVRSLVRFFMVQFWVCMVNFLSYMHFYVLKIVVGPATLSCILLMSGAHGFLLVLRRYIAAWLMHIVFTFHYGFGAFCVKGVSSYMFMVYYVGLLMAFAFLGYPQHL